MGLAPVGRGKVANFMVSGKVGGGDVGGEKLSISMSWAPGTDSVGANEVEVGKTGLIR